MTQITKQGERDSKTHAIIGAAMEVHNVLGCGFLESAYQEALAFELESRHILFRREVLLPLTYKGRRLAAPWKADFVVYDSVIVELKAVNGLSSVHEAQLIHYLRVSGLQVGLLLNFGEPRLQYHRYIQSPPIPLSA